MKTCVNETAEEVIGKRRGTKKEQWITQDTWKLIDEGKKPNGHVTNQCKEIRKNLTNIMQA